MGSYSGNIGRPDRTKAIVAVVAVHAALAAVILTGLNVSTIRQAVEHMTTIDIVEPPKPPPQPPPAPTPDRAKEAEGAAAKQAKPTEIVAPPPKLNPPSAGGCGAGRGQRRRGDVGRGDFGQRDRRRRERNRDWRRRQRRHLALHPGAADQQYQAQRLPGDCNRAARGWFGRRLDRCDDHRRGQRLPAHTVERRRRRSTAACAHY